MDLFTLRGWLVPAAAGLLLAGCQGQSSSSETTSANKKPEAAPTDTTSVPAPADGITAALLAKHIKVLASDEFQGRRPFTTGEEKATNYLASEFLLAEVVSDDDDWPWQPASKRPAAAGTSHPRNVNKSISKKFLAPAIG